MTVNLYLEPARSVRCGVCKQHKPIGDFPRDTRCRFGFQLRCNDCKRIQGNAARARNRAKYNQASYLWRKLHPERFRESKRKSEVKHRQKRLATKRSKRLIKLYGVTVEWFEEKSRQCGGVCEVCGDQPGGKHKRLFIDHDHATGAVRGLLCNGCNRAIGYLGDNPKTAEAIAAYLRKHGGKAA